MSRINKIKLYSLILLVGGYFFLTGCGGDTKLLPVEPEGSPGKILLKFNKTEIPQNVTTITASMSRGGYQTISKAMNVISDTTADLQINGLAPGVWHLKIEAKNNLDKVIYLGETDVTIVAATIIQVNLVLQPTMENVGGIYIFVTWEEPAAEKKWKLQKSGITSNLHSVFFCDSLLGWAVGDGGIIIKTSDAGFNWSKQNSGVNERLNSVFFLDINVGWAVGANGTALKTTDGGLSWTSLPKVTQDDLYSIKFVNTIIGLITGENGTVIYAYNEFDYLILKTIGSQENLTSAFYIRGKAGWITSSEGSIYKTTDDGKNWAKAATPYLAGKLNSIAFGDTSMGIAVGNSGVLLRTTNGGLNWNIMSPPGSVNLFCTHFINTNTGYIAAESGKIFKTTDSGINWTPENTETGFDLESISFPDPFNGWAVGKNGVILKYKQ